jgi:hypothetical protein
MSKSLITKTRISSFVIVGLLVSLLGNSFARASVPLTVVEGKKQELCPDGNGGQKSGDVDVLLLLDNSKSLNATNSPSDPENKRYEAIMVLLKALGDLTISESADGEALKLNFGLLSFGTNAKTLISLTELTTANAESLGRQVETQVPPILDKQESTTNYISAIATVLDEFSQRPNENCKVLVWFTDGQFESREINRSDPDKASKRKDQADELKSKVCGVDGFAERVRQLGINTFALVLQPTKPDERLKASYGAMQAITGVSTSMLPPQVQYGIDDYEDMCGDIRTTPLLGEVFLAQDAAEIARVVGLIDPRGNGTPVASCPSELEELEAQKMPAARHLKELTFVGRNAPTKLEDLDRAEIIDAFGIPHPLNEYLTPTSESGYRKVFVFNKKAEEKLDQGWTIKIDQGVEGWCVFAREHKFEVKFGGPNDGYEIAQVSDAGNLNDSDLQNLEFQRASDQSVLSDISEARAEAGEVRAFLSIDPTGLLFPEPIEIGVQQQSVPTISCELFSIKEIGDIRKSRRISSTCEFDTSETNLSTVTASITSSSGLAEKECNSKLFFTEPNSSGEVNDDSELTEQIELLKGKSQVVVVLEAQGDSASCVSDDSLVEFAFDVPGKGQVKIDRPVNIDLLWKKIPSPIVVWVLVFLAVLAAIILNLLLLREIKKRTSKLPQEKLFAYELPITLQLNEKGGVDARNWDGSDIGSHLFAVDKQITLKIAKSRLSAKLDKGSRSELNVDLPNIFRPFKPAVLVLKSSSKVLYWPSVDFGEGLSSQTRSALIVHSPQKVGDVVNATVTMLIPSTGRDKQALIRELLTSQLSQVVRVVSSKVDWFQRPGAKSQVEPIVEQTDSIGSKSAGGGSDSRRPPRPRQ